MHSLRVSVAEMVGRPGTSRKASISEPTLDMRVGLARVASGARMTADLRLESVVEGILVTGPASAPASFDCARCLTTFESTVEVDVCELFAGPGPSSSEEDAYRFDGEEIDLEPMLRDALTLALPLKPLCRADCEGLCPHCGREMAGHVGDCIQDTTDPRWAELDALRDQLESR